MDSDFSRHGTESCFKASWALCYLWRNETTLNIWQQEDFKIRKLNAVKFCSWATPCTTRFKTAPGSAQALVTPLTVLLPWNLAIRGIAGRPWYTLVAMWSMLEYQWYIYIYMICIYVICIVYALYIYTYIYIYIYIPNVSGDLNENFV